MQNTVKILLGLVSLSMANDQSTALVDRDTPTTIPMADYIPPSDLDNYINLHYPTEYRILDCWECFEAQGKVCSDEGHNSLFHHTKSSNAGNAFCCKPDSTNGYCQSGNKHDHYGEEHEITTTCSEKSTGASNKFSNILTNGRNHQMFAFCPSINHNKCGINSTSSSTNMGLKAGLESKKVNSNEMRYKKRNANGDGEYDACYYEISLDESVLDKYNPKKLHVKISEKSEMNVYLYGGKSRLEATESMISGNNQATIGQTYSIGVEKGIMIVAYPNEDKETDFGFEYWLEAELKPEEDELAQEIADSDLQHLMEEERIQVTHFLGATETQEEPIQDEEASENYIEAIDNNLFYGLCGAAGVLLLAIIGVCYQCRASKQKVKHVTENSDQNELSQPSSDDCNKEVEKNPSLEIVDMIDDEEQQSKE